MAFLSECPKCGSANVGFERAAPFGCDDCDWTGTSERLMEM